MPRAEFEPESVANSLVRFVTFEFIVVTPLLRVVIFDSIVFILPERVPISVEIEPKDPEMLLILPERAFCARVSV